MSPPRFCGTNRTYWPAFPPGNRTGRRLSSRLSTGCPRGSPRTPTVAGSPCCRGWSSPARRVSLRIELIAGQDQRGVVPTEPEGVGERDGPAVRPCGAADDVELHVRI